MHPISWKKWFGLDVLDRAHTNEPKWALLPERALQWCSLSFWRRLNSSTTTTASRMFWAFRMFHSSNTSEMTTSPILACLDQRQGDSEHSMEKSVHKTMLQSKTDIRIWKSAFVVKTHYTLGRFQIEEIPLAQERFHWAWRLRKACSSTAGRIPPWRWIQLWPDVPIRIFSKVTDIISFAMNYAF